MHYILHIFWNPQQHRPRALWRLFLFTVTFFVLTVGLGLVLVPFFQRHYTVWTTFGAFALEFVSVCLAALVSAYAWDRRPFVDFGFHIRAAWWRDFGFGLLLGALLMTGIFLLEWAVGWITVQGTSLTAGTVASFFEAWAFAFLNFIFVGMSEELLTRGYLLRNLAEGLNMRPWQERGAVLLAWFTTSTLFGLLHLGNPNMTPLSTLNLMIAGLFLGLGYVLTGELAIPIGIHITWNFFQGNVFGFPVSGISRFRQTALFITEQHGPPLWTGGAFGPEGGFISLVAMGIGAILILLWVRCHYTSLRLAKELAIYKRGTSFTMTATEEDSYAETR